MTDSDVFKDAPIVLVDVGDSEGFMSAVERLIVDEQARTVLRQSSARFFADQFSWSRITEQFLQLCLAR